MCQQRCAAQESAACAGADTRALTACRERVCQYHPQRRVAVTAASIGSACCLLQDLQPTIGYAVIERLIKEAPGPLEVALLGCDLGGAAEREQPLCETLAAVRLPLVHVDLVLGVVGQP